MSDTSRWTNIVVSLTLPTPRVPEFLEVAQTSAVVEWQTYYRPAKADQTKFSFIVELCSGANKSTCVQEEKVASSLSERVISTVDSGGVSIFAFSLKLTNLHPGMKYMARYFNASFYYFNINVLIE